MWWPAMLPRPLLCAALILLLTAGCRDREITSYRAPKDPAAAAPQSGAASTNELPDGHPTIGAASTPVGDAMAGTAVPKGGDSLTWTAPAHWIAQPDRPMRKATFAVKGDAGATADLSITAFPGDTGGVPANLNRWRGQIGLPPLPETEVTAGLEHLEANGLHVDVVDMAGAVGGSPTRLLGAIIPHRGETWFVKLTGPDALVAREKSALLEFLRTVRPR